MASKMGCRLAVYFRFSSSMSFSISESMLCSRNCKSSKLRNFNCSTIKKSVELIEFKTKQMENLRIQIHRLQNSVDISCHPVHDAEQLDFQHRHRHRASYAVRPFDLLPIFGSVAAVNATGIVVVLRWFEYFVVAH